MDGYLSEMKVIFDQLDSIGFSLTEQEKIYAVFTNLGREYEFVTTVIEHFMDTVPSPCYEDVVFKLTSFEDKHKAYTVTSEVTPHIAFQAEKGYFDRGGSGGYKGGRSGGYRGRGYSTRGCFFQQHSNTQSGQSTDSRPTCQICGKFGHSAAKCYNRFNESYHTPDITAAMAAMRVNDGSHHNGHEWLPDSGSTAHVTNSAQNCNNLSRIMVMIL